MPEGKHLLFVVARQAPEAASLTLDIAVLDLESLAVIDRNGSYPVYVPTGHVVYVSGARLFGMRFDLQLLEPAGSAIPLLEDVVFKATSGAADVSISSSGTLAYVAGNERQAASVLACGIARANTSAQGALSATTWPCGCHQTAGRRLSSPATEMGAFQRSGCTTSARETLTPLTPASVISNSPVWSESGRDVYFRVSQGFATDQGLGAGLYRIPASGTSAPELVLKDSPGGRQPIFGSFVPGAASMLIVTNSSRDRDAEIQVLDPGTPPQARPLIASAGDQRDPAISPDGRWIAYALLAPEFSPAVS